MSGTVVDTESQTIIPPESDGTNGTAASAQAEWPVPEFKYRMEDHPLWQEYVAELEANRQADIAEANRLADLEESGAQK